MMPLSFANPWMLTALVALPFLWWLLRVMPPSPCRISFPPLRHLLRLQSRKQDPATTPLWLALLRLLLAFVLILAAAHPLGSLPRQPLVGPLLLVVDDGWAAAKQWAERQAQMTLWLDRAERAGQPVLLLATAPPADGGPIALSSLLPVGQARSRVQALVPHPWSCDHLGAAKLLDRLPVTSPLQVVWLADGLDDSGLAEFAKRLAGLGPVERIAPKPGATAKLLSPPRLSAGVLSPRVRRAEFGAEETVTVRALDGEGRVLAEASKPLRTGEIGGEVPLPMPSELRLRVTRLELAGEATAGAVALLDQRWQKRAVGLVEDGSGGGAASPLLDELYYAEKALAPYAELRRGRVSELLKRELSLIVLPDQGILPPDERQALRTWIEKGGVLLRFAGPKLAGNPDDLLPVQLRGSGRMLGGALSWTRPMALAPMPETGPFKALPVTDEIRVKAQVLAEPGLDLNERSWARLEDGTPLVTGAGLGKGFSVLVHTTIGPLWSNFGLSGLFPAMLDRLLRLARGVEAADVSRPLAPLLLLDGFAHLSPATGIAEALKAEAPALSVGPRHPPGYYGDESNRFALNLGPDIAELALASTSLPSVALDGLSPLPDLQRPLLLTALFLLLLDMVCILWLSARSGGVGRGILLALLMALGSGAGEPARAEDIVQRAALQMRLAYVLTGEPGVDEVSQAGLTGLSHLLERRTTVQLGEPLGVDAQTDPLAAFPLLYWPVGHRAASLSPAAQDKVNAYMRHGGMILFDTRGEEDTESLRLLTTGLDIPPLSEVGEGHVLTRSFYLLRNLPGRLVGAPVYVQDGGDPANDNVSPVVLGGNDWAAAWAIDRRGLPMFAVVPGGEEQREMALRFGVNLVIYALTGSYKADQVHMPAILERLKR